MCEYVGPSTCRHIDASENHHPKISLKEELNHVITNILGITCEDRLHTGVNEHLHQCSQMDVISIESIDWLEACVLMKTNFEA